jgi:hypothetical protein
MKIQKAKQLLKRSHFIASVTPALRGLAMDMHVVFC